MQRLEVSGAVRPVYGSLGVKRLSNRAGEADHLLSHDAEVKNMWSFPSNPHVSSRRVLGQVYFSLVTSCNKPDLRRLLPSEVHNLDPSPNTI